MFFFGIFGMQSKQKEIRNIKNEICKNCGMLTVYTLIKTYNFFHIFFIPIFVWNKRYYFKTRCCSAIFQVSKELGEQLEKGIINNIKEEDLNPLNANSYNYSERCPHCGKEMDSSYNYCPRCGFKLR